MKRRKWQYLIRVLTKEKLNSERKKVCTTCFSHVLLSKSKKLYVLPLFFSSSHFLGSFHTYFYNTELGKVTCFLVK